MQAACRLKCSTFCLRQSPRHCICRSGRGGLGLSRRGSCYRQFNDERCAQVRLGGDPQIAMVVFPYDEIRDGQPQACTFVAAFGGEERIKDLLLQFTGHAWAVILDFHSGQVHIPHEAKGHGGCGATGLTHRLDPVFNDIEEDLLEFAGAAVHLGHADSYSLSILMLLI